VIETKDGSTDDSGSVPLHNIAAELLANLDSGETGVADAVDAAIKHAIELGASDLHFEPWDDCLSLRYRIDGTLHDVARLPVEQRDKITARIKILAKMVVYKKDVPQDGRIDADDTRAGHAMRVSTFPTVYGEKTVVRILRSDHNLFALDSLGFRSGIVAGLRDLVARPQGTLLLTGPSSSGKTTTIYALLRELASSRDPAPNIVTIEDPVEYRLGRIAQTQVNPHAGFTFDAALRSILRQDPEVIMVGEIRDPETARTAIQAGLTGHLVISTIHSGTAAGVFTRLLDMGIEPFLVASSVTGILAQRLVRVNCPTCTVAYRPASDLIDRFGVEEDEGSRFVRGEGCDRCRGIGYSGRMAIGEMLFVNEEISELVLARSTTRTLHEAAVRNGMATLAEDGMEKVENGSTTLEDLRRVLPPPGK
jgi:type II secretory ATPase GspE/PulE/Tfp pilus assembly ATPase PilB-like protein